MPPPPEPAPSEHPPGGPPERQEHTLADLVAQGRAFTATECLILLAELAHGEQVRVTAGEPPGRLDPESVVVLGPDAPLARPGPGHDPASTVWGLVAVAWFALTGARLDTATAPRRGATVIATAGPTLGPILVDALGGALSLDEMSGRLDAARADLASATRAGALTRAAVKHRGGAPKERGSARLPFRVIVAASLVLAVAAGLVVWWGHRGADPAAPTNASPSAAATLEPALGRGTGKGPVASTSGSGATTPSPQDTSPSPSTAATMTSSTSGSTSSQVQGPAAALRADPRGVLARVIDARTAAVVALDAAALAQTEVPDSPAWTADRALITQVVAAGARYEGLSLTVVSASVRTVSGTSAILEAVVDRSAYVVARSSGRQEVAAKPGRTLEYALTWSGSAWRLVEVIDPLEPRG